MANAAKPDGSRLYFAINEGAAGSKSQGWQGVLYQTNGAPIPLEPNHTVETYAITGGLPFGRFVGVAPSSPWHPHGAIPEVLKHGDIVTNNVMSGEWHYEIWLNAESSRSAGTWGELTLDGEAVLPAKANVTTAMGVFAWHENESDYGAHGWYPKR